MTKLASELIFISRSQNLSKEILNKKMDVDMKEVEIEFAQRLASGEPTIRKRALKLLREHVMEESKNGLFIFYFFS